MPDPREPDQRPPRLHELMSRAQRGDQRSLDVLGRIGLQGDRSAARPTPADQEPPMPFPKLLHDFSGPFIPASPGLKLGKDNPVCTQCGGLKSKVPTETCPVLVIADRDERVKFLLEPMRKLLPVVTVEAIKEFSPYDMVIVLAEVCQHFIDAEKFKGEQENDA